MLPHISLKGVEVAQGVSIELGVRPNWAKWTAALLPAVT